jgi:tetratricopeptide (TPR) repeat protein
MTQPPTLSRQGRRLWQRAEAAAAAGRRDAAISSLEALLAEAPWHAEALLQLSGLKLDTGDFRAAHAHALRAAGAPMHSPAWALLVMEQFVRLGESRWVLEICRQAPPASWGSASQLARVAQQLSRIGAERQAREYARAGAERDPGDAVAVYFHAHMEVIFGETQRAAELLEHVLTLHDDLIDPHWLLSRLRQPDPERRIARIERALDRLRPSGEHEAYLAYALHNEYHEIGAFDRAWQALERACRAKRSTLRYDPARNDALFEQLMGWAAPEVRAADGCPDDSLVPILIVGLHRSGTTLVERILGRHPAIRAGGETFDLAHQLRRASGLYHTDTTDPRIVARRGALDWAAIGRGYLDALRWRADGRRWVTDKLPQNLLNLGFAARALPHARFIHVERDPLDTGLSNLRTLFAWTAPHSYDQHEFVRHHRGYRKLMDHWHELLGDRLLRVRYEDVIADPERAARELAAFCGLSPVPGMTAIEESPDPVATASSVLVRDGIRRDRAGLWRHYADGLAPMREAFGYA